jgi:hypothetical protein
VSLSDEQHAALLELLRCVRTSADLLCRVGHGREALGFAEAEDISVNKLAFDPPTSELGELFSWPPSPPGTTASGFRSAAASRPVSSGVRPPSALASSSALQEMEGKGRCPRPRADATAARLTKCASLYLYFLILCGCAVLSHATMAALAYFFPELCGEHSDDDPPMIVSYGLVVSVVLAGLFLAAELVDLLPTGYADFHIFSCVTRWLVTRRRRKWARVSFVEAMQATDIDTGDHTIGPCDWRIHPQAHMAASPQTEADARASWWPRWCAWVAWAIATLTVTMVGVAILVLTPLATKINVHHAKLMSENPFPLILGGLFLEPSPHENVSTLA